MDLTKQQAMFSALEIDLHDIGLETIQAPALGEPQVGAVLQTMLAVTEDAHPVFLEMMVVRLRDDAFLLQFYTTVLAAFSLDQATIAQSLCDLNFYCPVGHFGIFEGQKQIYHKYTMLLDDSLEAQALAEAAMTALTVVYEIITRHYPLIAKL